MVTFDDARRLVGDFLRQEWSSTEDGTLYVADYGFEDATHWHVLVGAREYLVDDDWHFQRMDAPAYLVDKVTGEVVLLHVMTNFDRLARMARVNATPHE